MCKLSIDADPHFWEMECGKVVVDEVSLDLTLEVFFWSTLTKIAERDSMRLNELLTVLSREAVDADHTEATFTSFLRVCCGRYLHLLQLGEIPDDQTPVRQLDADSILIRERQSGLRLVETKD